MKDGKMSPKSKNFLDRVRVTEMSKKNQKKNGPNKSPQHLGIMKSWPEEFHQSESLPGKGPVAGKGVEDSGQWLAGQRASLMTHTYQMALSLGTIKLEWRSLA